MPPTTEKEPGKFISEGPYDGRVKNLAWRVLVHLCGEQPQVNRVAKKSERAVLDPGGVEQEELTVDDVILDQLVLIQDGLRRAANATAGDNQQVKEELHQIVDTALDAISYFRPQPEQPTLPFPEPSALEPQSVDS